MEILPNHRLIADIGHFISTLPLLGRVDLCMFKVLCKFIVLFHGNYGRLGIFQCMRNKLVTKQLIHLFQCLLGGGGIMLVNWVYK